jgi:hypothetical protein
MSDYDAERDPFLIGGDVSEPDPVVLKTTVHQDRLAQIDARAQRRHGMSIRELAEEDPRSAYTELGGLFVNRYIDFKTQDWGIGSVEEDGRMAFDGLTRYVAENSPPDLDLEEVEVIISVRNPNPWYKQVFGYTYTVEEALHFTAGPQDLAF